jgi:hypothetical protein
MELKYFYVSQEDITDNETELKEHFSNCVQFSNTIQNQCYIPLNQNAIRFFRVSGSNILLDIGVLRQCSGLIHIAYNNSALYSNGACTYTVL